ncbi:MAG: glutamate--tRNA ligase [Kiritimatiellae bacterium]|nr:glutamate--tRNA ligase [Kiritimatiellia bacterium]
MSEIRVRFAPSPTGKVHIGNIRAAIYNWLFARHTGGKFLLRVEDTDLERSTPEAIAVLFDCMKWLGLDWDEEVFYQTKNVKRHLEVVDQLLASGHAYKVEKTSRDGKTGVVTMFRMPKEGVIEFDDIVKGHMAKKAEDIQDFAIVRSDGSPIFHIANVVDDIDQRVTHIIRGDDHVENTFKHICIFRALGAPVPKYGHLSMIVNQQGKPYSKRDGAAFVGEYREQGYLPEALFNYLLLLGWNPGDDREVLTREEMVQLFELEKVHVTAAMFDPKKLAWMNGEYIKKIPADDYVKEVKDRVAGLVSPVPAHDDAWWQYLASQLQPRTKFLNDIPAMVRCFVSDDFPFDEKAVEKRLKKPGVKALLLDLVERFSKVGDWSAPALEAVVKELSQGNGMGPWVHPIRVAVSGRGEGIGLFEMLQLLGRDTTLARLRHAAETLAME